MQVELLESWLIQQVQLYSLNEIKSKCYLVHLYQSEIFFGIELCHKDDLTALCVVNGANSYKTVDMEPGQKCYYSVFIIAYTGNSEIVFLKCELKVMIY